MSPSCSTGQFLPCSSYSSRLHSSLIYLCYFCFPDHQLKFFPLIIVSSPPGHTNTLFLKLQETKCILYTVRFQRILIFFMCSLDKQQKSKPIVNKVLCFAHPVSFLFLAHKMMFCSRAPEQTRLLNLRKYILVQTRCDD